MEKEYLIDYLNLGNANDEQEIENKIVNNIRDSYFPWGKAFHLSKTSSGLCWMAKNRSCLSSFEFATKHSLHFYKPEISYFP